MEWYKVHEEAEQLEHAVSAEFERLLGDRLGPDGPCPHGNPPGPRFACGTPQTWLEADVRTRKRIVRQGDLSLRTRPQFAPEYLNSLGIRPGSAFQVSARNYDDTLSLKIEGRQVQLGRMAAERIWVSEELKRKPG